jgi:hypothetical protein
LDKAIKSKARTHLCELVEIAVHGAVQQAPPQSASQRIARHAEHGVGARVGDGSGEVRHTDSEAVAARYVKKSLKQKKGGTS